MQKVTRRVIAFVLALALLFTGCVTENMTVQAAVKPSKLTLNMKQASTFVGGGLTLK